MHVFICLLLLLLLLCTVISFMCKIPVSEYQEYPNVCGPRPEKSCVTGQKLTCTDLQQCGISLATVVTELPKPSLVL